jgi:hypothetical protein
MFAPKESLHEPHWIAMPHPVRRTLQKISRTPATRACLRPGRPAGAGASLPARGSGLRCGRGAVSVAGAGSRTEGSIGAGAAAPRSAQWDHCSGGRSCGSGRWEGTPDARRGGLASVVCHDAWLHG